MTDFQDRISTVRSDMGLSRRAFGELLDTPEAKIQKIEIGAQRADHEFLALLSQRTGVDMNWLLGNAPKNASRKEKAADGGSPDIITLPKIDVRASAGTGQPVYSEDEVGRYAVKRSWLERRGLKPENLSVITVVGNSMVPDLYEDDRIIIDHSQTDLKDTHIYAVRFSGDVFVKRIQRLPSHRAMMISKNSDYPPVPIDTDADFQVIGRVVSSMHEW